MGSFRRNLLWFPFLAALFVAVGAGAQTVYVRPDGDDGNGHSGLTMSASDAWRTLAHALDRLNANDEITEIHVAKGSSGHTYVAGDSEDDTHLITKPVVIIGGYVFTWNGLEYTESRDPGDRSTLSGDWGAGPNSWHIMTIAGLFGTVRIEGFRFTGGDATGDDVYNGGAILAVDYIPEEEESSSYSGPLELVDCGFDGNTAFETGGAVYLQWWRARVSECTFENNTVSGIEQEANDVYSAGFGGAIFAYASVLSVKNSTFTQNTVVEATSGDGGGGAIAIGPEAFAALSCANCVFRENSCRTTGSDGHAVAGSGGAVFASLSVDFDFDTSYPPILTNCLFTGNVAGMDGGAAFGPQGLRVSNCTIAGNSATDGRGGGIFVGARDEESETTISNSILWGNEAPTETDPDDPDHQFGYRGSVVDFDMVSTCVQWPDLSLPSGDNNINVDPVFADSEFRLAGCSPARQAGSAALLPEDVLDVNDANGDTEDHPWDLDRTARVKDSGLLDMGAYEHAEVTETDCPADLNGDHTVDGGDLGLLLGSWGPCDCQADLSCTANVDGGDLGLLLGSWGNCPGYGMMMSGGNSALDALMAYLGVETHEELIGALTALSFEDMSELLESFLGS